MRKDYMVLWLTLGLAFIISGFFGLQMNGKQGKDGRKYDYGIVKKGDTLFIYKDGKPVGCDVDSTGLHSIGDILEYAETGEEREIDQIQGNVTKILQTSTDGRGLTSIVYIRDGKDTLALDYLNKSELTNLLKK